MTTATDDDRLAAHPDGQALSRHQSQLLVITGFMGTGKTSVGRLVAQQLGRTFVDMDSVIQVREGKSVPEIFATRGEAHFRQCETELCKELSDQRNLVIATGGGTLVDSGNRASFRDAFVVCLDASVDALLARLKNAADRPLLKGDKVHSRVADLMSTRRAAYDQIERHIETTGKSVDQVAEEILALFLAAQNGDGRGAD